MNASQQTVTVEALMEALKPVASAIVDLERRVEKLDAGKIANEVVALRAVAASAALSAVEHLTAAAYRHAQGE